MSDEYRNAGGETSTQIARRLRDKYVQLYGWLRESVDTLPAIPSVQWDHLPANLKARWATAVDMIFEMYARREPVPAKAASAAFLDTIAGSGAFRKQHRILQCLWESVMRHGVDLVTAGMPVEGDDNRPEDLQSDFQDALNYNCQEWLEQRIKRELEGDKVHA